MINKLVTILLSLLCFESFSQEPIKPVHEKKVFKKDGNIYVQKQMPLYLKFSVEPDGENYNFHSKGTPDFADPMYLDTEGINFIRSKWAVNKDTVSLVGLSPTGQRLLTLSYDGIIFKEEYSNLLEEKIPGRAVMSYMQLAHWPKESINKALAKSEWSVKFSLKKRSLSYNGRHVLDILFENSDDKNISSLQTHYPKKIQIISSVMALQLDIEMLSVSVNAAP